MTFYGCGVYQYLQCYDKKLEKYQLLPHPYLRSFEVNNGEKVTKEKQVLNLSGEAGKKIWECIETMTKNKYWKTLEKFLRSEKEKIPPQCRIGKTFTSIAVIGGKIYSNNPRKMNHVHKYSK